MKRATTTQRGSLLAVMGCALALAATGASCSGGNTASAGGGGAQGAGTSGGTAGAHGNTAGVGNARGSSSGPVERQQPPAPGPRRDIHFPAIARNTLPNGLEVNVVEYHTLPVLHLRLVARGAGSSADPENLPGLASFTGDMLKEGTRTKTSAQIAEAIEFVGGTLEVTTTADATTISCSVLREHAQTALNLMTELVTEPIFPPVEIDKLRRRENDRLAQSMQDPGWLSRRAFMREVYGAAHPYGHYDTTPEALRRFTRNDLINFHRARFVAGSMFLAAVGDVRPAEFNPLVTASLGRIRRGTAPAVRFPDVPARTARQVVIVDRGPDSAQSVIRIGNVSLRRTSDDFVPLQVANQVLGGEASSRLFMDLRERRSLTYGAYSRVAAGVEPGTFQASGSVRTPVTAEALAAFMEHLDRIVREPPANTELQESERFLIDSFPLSIETAGDLATLLVDLRLYNLPDTYWDTYRTRIGAVTAEQALHAAQQYIHPDHAVVVVVGNASAFQDAARHLGPVRVVSPQGAQVRELGAESGPIPFTPSSPPQQGGGPSSH